MSATYRLAEVVVECGMGCGWTTEFPWSNRPDGRPGREGEEPPEPGEVFEVPLTCPDCEENGVHHSDLYPVKEVRNSRSEGDGSE